MSQKQQQTVPKFGSFKPKVNAPKLGEHSTHLDTRHQSYSDDKYRSSAGGSDSHRKERHPQHEAVRRHRDHDRERSRSDRPGLAPELHGAHQELATTTDEFDESDLFIVDRRGDRDNVKYGSLHRYSIPTYHRTGYGRLIGLPPDVKIDREESSDKLVVLSHARLNGVNNSRRLKFRDAVKSNRTYLRVIAEAPREKEPGAQEDFIPLSSGRKRKRGSTTPEQNGAFDYRSIEGKKAPTYPDDDDDLEYVSESDRDREVSEAGFQARHKNAVMVQQTKERPLDAKAWLALIEHQALLVCADGDPWQLTSAQKRAVADVRLSIYDQALRAVTVHQAGHEELVLGMMDEGMLVWDSPKLTAKWSEVLHNAPMNLKLWRSYLNFLQTKHSGFKFEQCKAAFSKCLSILHDARLKAQSGVAGDEIIQIYVFLRYTAFVRDAGYDELAHGLWQALLEYQCFRPHTLPVAKASLDALEEFWDKDLPRIGEEGAKGWSHYVEDADRKGRAVYSNSVGTMNASEPFSSFAELETCLQPPLHLPATADDDEALLDPFRHVMFSDMREVIECVTDQLPKHTLINAFVTFMGLPSLPSTDDGNTQHWSADQFLPATVSESTNMKTFRAVSETTHSLFEDAFDHFQEHATSRDSAAWSRVIFVDRALDKLCALLLRYDQLLEYYIAFQARMYGAVALKTAKRLLKARPSSLRLYNAYALAEWKVGKGLQKASEVWSTALSLSTDLGEQAKEERILLWRDWMMARLLHDDPDGALSLLISTPNGTHVTTLSKESSATLTASQRLKTKQHFEIGCGNALYAGKVAAAACHAECHLWFTYLSEEYSLDSALEQGRRYSALLSQASNPGVKAAEELSHQAQARLVRHHMNCHRPYKPAAVRSFISESIRRFPSNSIFSDLYSHVQHQLQIEDRIRASLHNETLSSIQSNVIGWSCILADELRRYNSGSAGATENSVQRAFVRALRDSNSPVGHSLGLWTQWLRFETSRLETQRGGPSNTPTAQRRYALASARQVFSDGLRQLPWSKAWVIMGLRCFSEKERMSQAELRQVYDVLVDREMRIRVGIEEIEDVLAAMDA